MIRFIVDEETENLNQTAVGMPGKGCFLRALRGRSSEYTAYPTYDHGRKHYCFINIASFVGLVIGPKLKTAPGSERER